MLRDFPPTFTTFLPGADGELATFPDTRSPGAFLRWHLGQQPGVIAAATFVGFLWQLPLTLGPWLVGNAVDEGILAGSASDLLLWVGLLGLVTVVGAVFGIAMHTLVVRSWLIALYYGTIQMCSSRTSREWLSQGEDGLTQVHGDLDEDGGFFKAASSIAASTSSSKTYIATTID